MCRRTYVAVLLASALAGASAGADAPPRLERVPFPVAATLEPVVAAQIRGLEEDLNRLLAARDTPAGTLTEAFGDLGQLFHAYELWESASAAYRNAMQLDPRDYRWVHLLADADTRRGDLEAARRDHEGALALRPGDLPSLVGLGETLLALNRLDEARRALLEAARIDPRSAAAHAGLARVALVHRDYTTARDELEIALGLVPDANRLHYELAMAYRGLGDRDASTRELARAGNVGVKVSDPLLEEVSERRRGERAHLVRARLAFVNGRMREAAGEFAAAVGAEPKSVAGLVGLGSALGMLGETDRAVEALLRALALAPDNTAAHYNLARLLAARGDAEAALAEYDTLVRLAPEDEDAALGKADLLARRDRFAEARETLEDAHRQMPGKGRVVLGLAYLLAASPDTSARDGARALALARTAWDAAPDAASGRVVALALAELGRCGEAEKWLGRLLEGTEKGRGAGMDPLRAERERAARGAPCRPPGRSGPARPAAP